jgi:hypothetical protein
MLHLVPSRYRASECCPVHIYDTKGFETLDAELEQLHQLVQERRAAAGGITWRIHGESLSNCMQCGG